MAKRWRNMSESERAGVTKAHAQRIGETIREFTEDGSVWDAFLIYARSIGDLTPPVNVVDAFAQHRTHGVAKVSDMRTWADWIKAGRTPRAGRKVTVLTTYPLHMWDVADTDVTDRKAWRNAPAPESRGDGEATLRAVAEIIRESYGVFIGIPAVDVLEPVAPADVVPTTADVQRARLRAEGYTGSLDAMMRAEWRAEIERLHVVAEGETRGGMLNERGRTKGVDTRDLIGNVTKAKAYASAELRAWFNSIGGVPTFQVYRAKAMGEQVQAHTFADVAAH